MAWLLCAASASYAAAGDLDSTFGLGGKQTLDFGGSDRAAHATLTPDGRIVVVGSTDAEASGDYAVARFTANGASDTSFNSTGRATIGTDGVTDSGGGAVVLPDERIVVTGTGGSARDFVTKRLNADGTLDNSFAGPGAGTSVVNFGANDEALAMARAPDGKLVIVGSSTADSGSSAFAVARLNADGTPDTTFNGTGQQTIDFTGGDSAYAVAVAPDGKIVVTGRDGDGHMVVARLDEHGQLDSSFPSRSLPFGTNARANAIALQSDGKVVLAGQTYDAGSGDFAIARLNTDGSLDNSFSGDGLLTLGYGAPDETAKGVAIQPDGKIAVMGGGDVNHDFVVTRLGSDGSSDTSFGTGGTVAVDFGGNDLAADLALQPDGKLVLAGSAPAGAGTYDFAVARLQADAPPPPPPPTRPVASFTVPSAPVQSFHQALLDASDTSNASRLLWDFNSDGHVDLVEPAGRPVLGVRFPKPGAYDVTLTADGAGGITSIVTHPLFITGPKPPPALFAQIRPAMTMVAAPDAQFRCGVVGETITFGAAQARGCFDMVDSTSKLPLAEFAIFLNNYVSPSMPIVVASICRQAAQGKLPQSSCDKAKQTFGVDTQDFYVSNDPVNINGVTITPVGPARVVICPRSGRVVSSLAIVTWGGMPVAAGPLDWNLALQTREGSILHTGKSGFAPLLDFDASKIGEIAGFKPTGSVSIKLRRNGGNFTSEGRLELQLPNQFDFLGGKAPSAGVGLIASNDNPPVLDHLDLSVPEANLGAVDLTDLRFRYELGGHIDGDTDPGTSCNYKQWKAQANIYLIGTPHGPNENDAGFRMSPPPSQNGVGFCAGGFKHAGAKLTFGGPESPLPAPQIFPGVFLSQVNLAVQLNPTLIRGGAGINAAKLTYVDGAALVAFAKPWEPYHLNTADAGNEFATLAGRRFTSTTVAIGGDVFMDVPEFERIRFGSGAMMYSYPDFVFVAGEVRVVVPGLAIFGGLSGEADLRTRKFETSAHIQACLGGIEFDPTCPGAEVHLGSRGVSACLSVLGLHPGAGYRWADHYIKAWLPDGCKPSRFWEENIHAKRARAALRAGAGLSVTLAKGESTKSIELVGAGGAPSVTLRRPDGRALTITGDRLVAGNNLSGIRVPQGNRTFLGIKGGPGTYRIDLLSGSAPVARLLATRKGYDSNFTARVTGRGNRRTLIFDARRKAGQLVTFAERGRNVFKILGTSNGGRGKLRFTPAIGPGGKRQIIAIPTIDGTPIPDQTLTSYVAPGIVKPGRPGRVRVQRKGTRLNVSWKPAAGAVRYAVVLRLSDGSMRTFKLGFRGRGLRIARVPLERSGSVQVSAQGVLHDWGRPGSALFKRLRRPLTVQQTKKSNERLTYLKQHHKH